jgi:Holliday junction resolvase
MREAELQKKIVDRLNRHGWSCIKLIQTNMNGIPDLMCIRKGVVMFLEVKTEKGVVAPLQEKRIADLNKHGVFARVVRSVEDIDIYCYKNI